MTDYPSMDRLANLQQMIADFSKIKRTNIPFADNDQPENDTEHSFGLALTCWYLQPKIAPKLDLLKVLQYALAHDLVELYAGDTYVFDSEGLSSKPERESSAVKQLSNEWSDFPDISRFAKGYMDKVNEEAKFVKAVDKILPVIMIELANEPNFWQSREIDMTRLKKNKETMFVSNDVHAYYKMLFDWLDERGNIPKS